jgi:hypothetical protein
MRILLPQDIIEPLRYLVSLSEMSLGAWDVPKPGSGCGASEQETANTAWGWPNAGIARPPRFRLTWIRGIAPCVGSSLDSNPTQGSSRLCALVIMMGMDLEPGGPRGSIDPK